MVVDGDDLGCFGEGTCAVKLDRILGPGKEGIQLALDIEREGRGEAILDGVDEVGGDCRA